MRKVVGLIPVRLESTRLPGKALKEIEGLPAIVHVYKRALFSNLLDEIYVCTDSVEIEAVCKKYFCKVIKTGRHRNGSERIYEASKLIDTDIIINIQGDEVLVDPIHIDLIVESMNSNPDIEYCMGITPFNKANSPQDFKAVLNSKSEIIYCSRSDIPSQTIVQTQLQKLVFIVGFTKSSLKQFVSWPESDMELSEPNEFLRIIENDKKIKAVQLNDACISLDTEDDLQEIRQKMRADPLHQQYMESLK